MGSSPTQPIFLLFGWRGFTFSGVLVDVTTLDLHVAFTRHRASARMFVQDISVLRQVGNRSLIKDVTARDLEKRKIVNFAKRVEEA